jgi:precorrin-2/cobalt-factor-2 C20-methyltransferase
MTVLMATLSEEELTARAANTDALVVMKIGRNLDKLKRALGAAGRLDQAWLVERGTMCDQTVQKLTDAPAEVPYFSIAIVHGQGRRP